MLEKKPFGVFLSYVLRHAPQRLGLTMDNHGWVSVVQLLEAIEKDGQYTCDMATLQFTVATDDKGRFRLSPDLTQIKACQGHSVPWVEPEVSILSPPSVLYHGTTTQAYEKIKASGAILKMSRHAVHLHADKAIAWSSGTRWGGCTPVLLVIDAQQMSRDGIVFGRTENMVWCVPAVDVKYIKAVWHKEDIEL